MIAGIAGQNIKQVALELRGKSASLVLPVADQACRWQDNREELSELRSDLRRPARLLVPSEVLNEVSTSMKTHNQSFPVGNPSDSATVLGPVATAEQRDKVMGLTAAARRAGAQVLASGPVSGEPSGFHVSAEALLTSADKELAQEMVFDRVLPVVPYADLDEAVAIANNSDAPGTSACADDCHFCTGPETD